MEKEIGSVLGTKYWRRQFASWMRYVNRTYKNYISKKNGRWLMYFLLILWMPFAILLIPFNFLLNSLTGYYKQKRFNEALTIIKYRDDRRLIAEKIQEVLDKPRKSYVQKGKKIAFVCNAEAIVRELYQRGFYAEMLPVLEELNAIFCKDRHLPKYYTNKLILAESYCKCGKVAQAREVIEEIVKEINDEGSMGHIDCDFSYLCKTVCIFKEYVDDESTLAHIYQLLKDIKGANHYEDNQYFNQLLN